MPPHDIKDGPTLVRRVSFSDRLHYSDDASSTTVTTDDDLYQDDCFLISGSDEESTRYESDGCRNQDNSDDDTEKETNTDVKNTVTLIEENSEEAKDTASDDSDVANKEVDEQTTKAASGISSEYQNPLDDEPPLVIRDVGVYERPSEYLGGYEPEGFASSCHRVKLRKSWLGDVKDEESKDEPPHDQFEAWKKSRVTREPSFKKKQHKKEGIVNSNDRAMIPENKDDVGTTVACTSSEPRSVTSELGKRLNDMTTDNDEHGENIPVVKPMPPKMIQPHRKKYDKTSKCKTEAHGSGSGSDSASHEDVKSVKIPKPALTLKTKVGNGMSMSDAKSQTPSPAFKRPKVKDPEIEADEKEIQELRERITKLQRTLDVTEVRTISQLADLEEETTKRMRDYRSKANNMARKSRAAEERQSLKEKAMRSQDLIDLLRRSNQALRVEGVKMKKAIEELKKTNERLKENNYVHMDYVATFRDYQNMEVLLTEDMNEVLNKAAPKYEKLIRGMEECVKSRGKSAQGERKAKDLYVECVESIFALVEANSIDNNLIERVESMLGAKFDDETQMDKSTSDDEVKRATTTRTFHHELSKCDNKTANPKKVSKRQSVKSSSLHDEGATPIKKISRGYNSSDGVKRIADAEHHGSNRKKAQLQQHQHARSTPRRSSSSSFRSIRSLQKASYKVVSDDDDASTCSNTSAQSETYSLSSSVAGYFK